MPIVVTLVLALLYIFTAASSLIIPLVDIIESTVIFRVAGLSITNILNVETPTQTIYLHIR